MALDIRLRELSNGERGILDLMKDLSERYGKNKPFEDDALIPAIVELTHPEVQQFLTLMLQVAPQFLMKSFWRK